MKRKILPQEALKLIACVTMFIDHFGATIVPKLSIPYATELYYACRIIGRIAFPIYCFLLVQGMTHTRNPFRYILRLGIGILLAELPFDFLFEGGFSWQAQSVMVTLTLGAVMLLCMEKTEKKWRKLLLVLPFAGAAELLMTDYGGRGIAMIAVFALFDQLNLQTLALLFCTMMSSDAIKIFGIRFPAHIFAVLSMIPIAGYSGVKLTRSKAVQWGFYLFYPLHMLFLWVILRLMG